jgi:glutamate dehydrogenase (NAD(P)+)
MYRRGYKIVGVSTSASGLYNKNGIDIDALWMHYMRANTLVGYPGAEETDTAALLVTDCDILIPAALENQITSRSRRAALLRKNVGKRFRFTANFPSSGP